MDGSSTPKKDQTTIAVAGPAVPISPVYAQGEGPQTFFNEPISDEKSNPIRRATTRKQTLIAFIDELTALRDEEQMAGGEDVSRAPQSSKKNTVSVDERLQTEGANMFFHFNKRIRQVDTELLNFANSVRPLGSSVGLISSSYHLRARLQQILHLFRENAADLFPAKVAREPAEPVKPFSSRKRSKTRKHRLDPAKAATRMIRPIVQLTSELEEFPKQFELLAQDLVSFLHFLHDIPEFTDEELNGSVLSAEADLKYWASCLREFPGQFRNPAIQRYVNDLTKEMDGHLEDIRDALRVFRETGVSTIKLTQNHTQNGLQNLSTVATFFSAVTASTLQYSWDTPQTQPGTTAALVNGLWIASLVFSIASSINSQLAYHWRAAMYRSPRSAVPWWVSIWLTRTPLIFLVVAVIAFSAGLCVWTYSSKQGRVVSICTTVFTSFTLFALIAVAVWFACERWAFSKTKGRKWLADIAHDAFRDFKRVSRYDDAKKGMGKASKWSQEKMEGVKSASAKVAEKIKAPVKIVAGSFTTSSGSSAGSVGGQDLEFGGIADARPSRDGGSSTLLTVPFRGPHSRKQSTGSVSSCQNSIANGGGSSSGHGGGPLTPVTPRIMEDAQMTSSPVQDDNLERSGGVLGMVVDAMAKSGPSNPPASAPPTTSPGRLRFKQIGLKVIKEQRKKATLGMGAEGTSLPPTPRRQSTSISLTTDGRSVFSRHDTLEARFSQLRPSRFVAITSALKKLSTSQLLTEHQALVRHLQFSPDGKYLATGSWDRRAIIWKVGEEASCSQHRTLAHSAKGGFIGQVSWSPTGAYLLTKTSKLIKIWSVETGHLIKDIVRHHRIQAVTWLPDGKCFAGVEHDQVHIMDLNGQVLATHRFERMEIHDVAFLPEGERMLLVATLEKSPTDLKPSKSRAEKRIVVYNMSTMKSESQVPVLENVRDVTVSADGQHALVSYEDTAPPEVWRIHMIPGEAGQWARLSLLYTYIPATPVEFAGPSYFGGANDQFIICAGKNGEIHIWDRESGLLLHSLQASQTIGEESGDLTGIAWNHAFSGYFMFASANHDGTVRVWTAPAPPETQPPSRAESPQQMDGRFRALSF